MLTPEDLGARGRLEEWGECTECGHPFARERGELWVVCKPCRATMQVRWSCGDCGAEWLVTKQPFGGDDDAICPHCASNHTMRGWICGACNGTGMRHSSTLEGPCPYCDGGLVVTGPDYSPQGRSEVTTEWLHSICRHSTRLLETRTPTGTRATKKGGERARYSGPHRRLAPSATAPTAKKKTMSEPGDIECLNCGSLFREPPDGWVCTSCGGPVSQHMGTIHVGRALDRLKCPDCDGEGQYEGRVGGDGYGDKCAGVADVPVLCNTCDGTGEKKDDE